MSFLVPRYGERRRGSVSAIKISGVQLLTATFKQLKKVNQQLLILITVFIGMEQAFIGAEFTQAYVSCALGIHQIGYVMICFGVVNAICSIIFGSIMKYIGRIPIILLGNILKIHTRRQQINALLYRCPRPRWSYPLLPLLEASSGSTHCLFRHFWSVGSWRRCVANLN